MIYKFRSKVAADVIFMPPAAEQLLRLLGKEPSPSGIFQKADLPAAIDRLQAAVAHDELEFARLQQEAEAAGEAPPRRAGVTLKQRAWPLLDMMQASWRADTDVVWSA